LGTFWKRNKAPRVLEVFLPVCDGHPVTEIFHNTAGWIKGALCYKVVLEPANVSIECLLGALIGLVCLSAQVLGHRKFAIRIRIRNRIL
jgi:hypothetical protein